MRTAKRFLVQGRVQGVGFRFFATTCAEALGVAGWVRNTPEGNVEVHAEGDDKQLEQLAFDLSRGPRYARVTRVDAEVRPVENLAGFRQVH